MTERMHDTVRAGDVANMLVPKKTSRRSIREMHRKTQTDFTIVCYGVFCAARLDAETQFIATYSTRRRAEEFIEAQEANVRLWLPCVPM